LNVIFKICNSQFDHINFYWMRTNEHTAMIILLLILSGVKSYSAEKIERPLKFYGGISTGFHRGFGIRANVTAFNFAAEFPFELRFGAGYTILNPGNAEDARRIFINNATNGVPEKKGSSFDLRLDFKKSKSIFGIDHSYLVFGPRFSTFKGDFKYIGGNEDFEVRSKQFGIGGGIENHFKIAQNLTLFIDYGFDFYFPSTLTGHDTSYSPDNDNVNPENDNENNEFPFNYRDANKAIYQPMLMPYFMIGVNVNL